MRICKHEGYLSHTRPIFHYINTLCIYDMIEYSSVVFMFKVYNNQFPRHMLCFFERLYDSHSHNTRKKVNNFKTKYSRTTQKTSCISVIGFKLWNNLHSDLQCSTSISRFTPTIKECYSKDTNTWTNYHSTLSSIVYSFSCLFRHLLYSNCILNAL